MACDGKNWDRVGIHLSIVPFVHLSINPGWDLFSNYVKYIYLIQSRMDTAEHPDWRSRGPKGNVNLLKLDVHFFTLLF